MQLIKRLVELLKRLVGKKPKPPPGEFDAPSSTTNLQVRTDIMKITASLPSSGPRQRPVAKIDIGMRVKGAPNFDVIGTIDATHPSVDLDPTLAPGDYQANAVVYDTAGVPCVSPQVVDFAIAFDPPSATTDLTVVP